MNIGYMIGQFIVFIGLALMVSVVVKYSWILGSMWVASLKSPETCSSPIEVIDIVTRCISEVGLMTAISVAIIIVGLSAPQILK